MEKCFVCGANILLEDGDAFHKTSDGKYMCGKHGIRTNRLIIDVETVEAILEEKFGGTSIVRGEVEFIIDYN